MKELLLDWSLSRKTRITVDHERAATWLSAGKKTAFQSRNGNISTKFKL